MRGKDHKPNIGDSFKDMTDMFLPWRRHVMKTMPAMMNVNEEQSASA